MVGWREQIVPNRLGTHGGAGGDFGAVIVRVFKSRRWFGQTVTVYRKEMFVPFRGVEMGRNCVCCH